MHDTSYAQGPGAPPLALSSVSFLLVALCHKAIDCMACLTDQCSSNLTNAITRGRLDVVNHITRCRLKAMCSRQSEFSCQNHSK